jgi:hypothetical protein
MFGWVGDAVDAVGDVAEDVGGAFVDAAEAVGGAIGEGAEAAAQGAGIFGGALADVIDWSATAVDTATGGLAGAALNFADDTLFDTIDTLTFGAVNVDFDDGNFGVDVGVPGVATWGASMGEDGIAAHGSMGVAEFEGSLGRDGLSAGGQAGIDWGPLPYAEGHIDMGADGTVSIDGRAQGTIPTPIGLVSGEADVGFGRTPDGAWAMNVNADGTLTLPSGTYIGGGVDFAHMQNADGDNITSLGLEGRVGEHGVGEVSAGAGYTHIEQDGVTMDTVTGHAEASGYGFEAGVQGGYNRLETAGGDVFEQANVSGHVSGYGQSAEGGIDYVGGTVGGQSFGQTEYSGDVSFDADKVMSLGAQVLGDQFGGDMPKDANGLVGMLGDGATGNLLNSLGGDVGSFLGSLDASSASALVDKMAGDGTIDALLGAADPTAVKGLLGKVSESGGLNDLLGSLDGATTASLVGALSAPDPVMGAAQDVAATAMGAATDAASAIAAGTSPQDAAADVLGTMSDAATSAASALGSDATVTGDFTADVTIDPATGQVAVDATADVTVDAGLGDPLAPPAPVDDFNQQIASADQAEESVDALFDDLGT